MAADVRAHLQAWWCQRQVQRTTTTVAAATVASLAACAWRIRADGSTAAAGDLAAGHRYLLVPLALVVLVAAGLAGSVASWNGAAGWSAVVAATGRSTRQGWLVQALVAALGAATWAMAVAGAISLAAAGVLAAVGGGPSVGGAVGADLVVLVVRVGLSAGGLGLLAGATGLVLPGRALAGVVAPALVLGGEVAGVLASNGAVNLVGGAALGVLLVGADQGHLLGLDPGAIALVCALVWLAIPMASLAVVAVIDRTKGLG